MSTPDKEGFTHRERIEGMLERTRDEAKRRELEAELDLPPFPISLNYLWQTYMRLRGRVSGNGYGPNPISWEAIDAFCRRSGRRFYPWEVELLEAVDDAFLAATAKQG